MEFQRRMGQVGPGSVLDEKYEILRLIGEGGMGQVWEARHTQLGHGVAIKVPHPGLSGRANVSARFRARGPVGAQLLRESFQRTKRARISGAPSWILNGRNRMKGRKAPVMIREFCLLNPGPGCP